MREPYRTTLPRLVETMRHVKSNPRAVVKTGIWSDGFWSAARCRAWFRSCLADKINAKDPRYPRGRKAGDEYQTELARLRAQYIGNRVIIDWVAPCLGARVRQALAHRLRCNRE